jgi:non-specific serine/threonine protein kinase
MPVLTPELISSYNIYYHTDFRTVQRGQQLFRQQKAVVSEFSGDSAICEVHGPKASDTVEIRLVGKRQLQFSCTCTEWDSNSACQHIVASLMALSQYLVTEAYDHWEYKLSLVLDSTPKKALVSHRQRYAVIFGLKKETYYQSTRYGLAGYTLRAVDWPALETLGNKADPAALNELLEKDRTWQRLLQSPYQAINPAGSINLPPEGIAAFNLLLQTSRYYYTDPGFANYLPLLGRLNAPLFLVEGQKFGERIQVLPEPVEIETALARGQGQLVLQAGLELAGERFTMLKDSLAIVNADPAWVLAGRYLAPIKNPQSLPLLTALPLTIPPAQEERFRGQYLREIAERVPIKGDVIAWEDVEVEPVPRLYLEDDQGGLRASLRFGYGDYELPVQLQPDQVTLVDQPDSWAIVRIHRQGARELAYYQLLADPIYRLKRAGREFSQGTFALRSRAHPFDFLLHSIPLLTQAGFEIYGEEKLKAGKINRAIPTISLNITSGLDWFDLEAVVRYGDQEVALRDIRRAVRKHERYIKLADGSIGQIPEVWLERYKHLFEMAQETGSGLRVADFHLPLVDELLEEAELKQVAPEFEERRKTLSAFESIQPQAVPEGFQGELRPYQKSGLDWLHFLHQYRLGGCLADDMGLGKTIQVLAFLQSLREQGQGQPASMLVVPKSLLANWQREAERFTPGLRFLEYVGNLREKDTSQFNDYDVVLTTYGIMLRDVELLSGYRFHFAILDESQAIKNPNAQSAKAARLLSAEHRLALTGTPVQNNTFELWSLFAFLNPGLLGNLDYFKRAFALPIEGKRDEETARLLRQLVYPFILRRTKEQVTPELPPRTERILYTSMEPAQRKLYNQTRDRYRGILLGMIESEGMDNVRMKILEGLLRLRQICIHPVLVEPTYRGDAPKFELLFETLQTLDSENHKALVFSQFIETLKIVRKELDKQRVPYAYLDGQTQNRQEQVDLFQENPQVRFFLISLKAGGLGLNLTAADYVIHLDPWWNPAVEMQASDRAHRIGQDKPVFIYKLIARESVEEKILQLQDRKRALVDQLISTESSFFKSLTADDVKILFS